MSKHCLRATFAAEIKRVTGANDDQVAAALGDRDTRMGAHYTRHVEAGPEDHLPVRDETMGEQNKTGFGKREGFGFPKAEKGKEKQRQKAKGGALRKPCLCLELALPFAESPGE